MCIIAIKSKGIDIPNEEILQNMWRANRDGAGFMYAHNGVVNIEKGFMTYESFYSAIRKLDKKYGLKNLPLIMHFRITTHGGTKPENTHPFPITDSVGVLKKLNVTAKIGVAHNGIIDIRPREGISDTMEYVASQLAPLSRAMPKFYKNADLMEMVANAIGGSRMAFMNGDGDIYTIGAFVEEGGMRYSNRSFETPKSTRYFPYSYYDETEAWADYFVGKEASRKETTMRVMWLDEGAGEFVITDENKYEDGDDYAIDYEGKVYAYSYEEDMLVLQKGYRAFNGKGYALQYDWRSPRALVELVSTRKE